VTFVVAEGNVSAIKNHTATVNPANYTIDNGTISFTVEYLETLSVGEKNLTVITDKGNVPLKIIVVDTE